MSQLSPSQCSWTGPVPGRVMEDHACSWDEAILCSSALFLRPNPSPRHSPSLPQQPHLCSGWMSCLWWCPSFLLLPSPRRPHHIPQTDSSGFLPSPFLWSCRPRWSLSHRALFRDFLVIQSSIQQLLQVRVFWQCQSVLNSVRKS